MTAARPILVLGGDGQIGWELLRALAPLGPVAAPDPAHADLTDADGLIAFVRDMRPTLIVNAAAYTAVDDAESNADLAMAINGTAPGVLAEEAKRLGAGLVHYSTDYVFDGTARRPYRESDPTQPINAYGDGKRAGEEAIQSSGCSHLILRTSWVYSDRGHNFLRTIQRLTAERDELSIVADQIGTPNWARTIAGATALVLARCGAPGEIGGLAERAGLYHLSGAGKTSWHGFAEAIVAHLRGQDTAIRCRQIHPITSAEYPTPARRPANSVLDSSALAAAFGVRLPDWRDQLRLCLDS